jgi:hypothetical protein
MQLSTRESDDVGEPGDVGDARGNKYRAATGCLYSAQSSLDNAGADVSKAGGSRVVVRKMRWMLEEVCGASKTTHRRARVGAGK